MTDPRAIRVRLSLSSAADRDVPMVVAPGESPHGPVLAQRHATVDGRDTMGGIVSLDAARHRLDADGVVTTVILEPARAGPRGVRVREVLVDGFRFLVESEPERLAALRERATRGGASAGHAGPLEVRAVIPGRVVSVAVAPGDTVTTGGRLLVIEAMKMQNELRSSRDGTIVRVGAVVGGTVEIGDLLVVIE
jgi:biotin carboxyl carrier protein